MGYFPNAAARLLKTNHSNNIGVLFIDEMQSGLAHEYFSAVLNSVKNESERLGYDITFISRNIGEKPMSYYNHCKYRNCDGVVIACVDFNDPEVIELIQSKFPTVTIDIYRLHCNMSESKSVLNLVIVYDNGKER